MTSEQIPDSKETKQPVLAATGNTTNIDGGVQGSVLSGTFHAPVTITTQQALPGLLTPQERRNRVAMLQKVKLIWIDGLLKNSLAETVRIELGLATRPDAVDLGWNAVVQELHQPPRLIPVNTPIIDVFTYMSGSLLILGAPGAGKTTILLELARDLITQAESDDAQPIPVLFNLTTWANSPQSLEKWLVEELNQRYSVSKKVAQKWIVQGSVLPLLDGLDEVALEDRNACVEAINTYRLRDGGLLPIAVCSRIIDYEALATKLQLQGAVVVQPVTYEQVEEYLEQAGDPLVGLRIALQNDKSLWELLDTPLMLSIAALAYQGKSTTEIPHLGTATGQREGLFNAYLNRMFQRRSTNPRCHRQQTTDWLSWLAHQMIRHNQTIFYIERMQPYWLSNFRRWKFAVRVGLSSWCISIIAFCLIFSLILGPATHLVFTADTGPRSILADAVGLLVSMVALWAIGLGIGMLVGLLVAVVCGIMAFPADIRPVETLRWSWKSAGGGRYSSLLSVVVGGIALGVSAGLVAWLKNKPDPLQSGLTYALQAGLPSWIIGWLIGEMTGDQVDWQIVRANKPFRRLVLCIIIGGLAFWLLRRLIITNDPGASIISGLIGAFAGGLLSGLALPGRATTPQLNHIRRASWVALATGLLTLVICTLGGGLEFGLGYGLMAAIGGGAFGWFGVWLIRDRDTNAGSEHNRSLRRFARNALSMGLCFGIVEIAIATLTQNPDIDVGVLLSNGLSVMFVAGLGGGLLSSFVEEDIVTRVRDNEGIRRSIYNTKISMVISGLSIGFIFGLSQGPDSSFLAGLSIGVFFGLIAALIVGLLYGGAIVLQHYALRWLLFRKTIFPWNPAPFLDHCVERIFLRRVGGGWIFVHRLLMEHFASLYQEKPPR